MKHINPSIKEIKRSFNINSPYSANKIPLDISPAQNDSFSGFQKDDFQLKNESDQKHSKMVDFPYPDTLLSNSASSDKTHLQKLMKGTEMGDDGCIKKRLFEKENNEYGYDENSSYNILNSNEHPGYIDKLITPPPKNSLRMHHMVTDQKQSGMKYYHNELLDKYQPVDPPNMYYHGTPPGSMQCVPQVVYKSYKYKQTSYPYLIPLCNKCNLPPILPIPPDFEIEMMPPAHMAHSPPEVERENLPPPPAQNSVSKPKEKKKPKKKPSVDENGKKIIRRRKRKSLEQLQLLFHEFNLNPDWTKEDMQEVARKSGLSEGQVYKWSWDQKRKIKENPNYDPNEELEVYRREQDEASESSGVHKFKLPSSMKKQNKSTPEFQVPKTKSDKSNVKTRRTALSDLKTDSKDNQENEYNINQSKRSEKRGLKRKLKFSNQKNKQNDLFTTDI